MSLLCLIVHGDVLVRMLYVGPWDLHNGITAYSSITIVNMQIC